MNKEEKQQVLAQAKAEISKTAAFKTLQAFFDEGAFSEIDALAKSEGGYAEVVAAYGTANGCPVFAFAQNTDIAGGAMSKAQAAKLRKLYELAVKTGTPVVGFYDSVGARLTQGVDMLASFGGVLNSVSTLSGVVPQISVVLGACLGTSALCAVSADFVIMTEKAKLTLETNGQGGSPEQNEKDGTAHLAAKDAADAIQQAKALLSCLPSNNLSVPPAAEALDVADQHCGDITHSVFDSDSFFELQKNYAPGARTAFARLYGSTVGVVLTSGAVLGGKECEKAAKFVRFCDAFAIPVITFADSKGFDSVQGAAKLTAAYADATTVKATVVTGEAYGAFYIAVAGTGAGADLTLAWNTASISALAPLTGATIMWSDKMNVPADQRSALVEEYKNTECSAFNAAAEGYVEDVIDPEDTRAKLFAALDMLAGKRVTTLPKKHGTI